MNALDCRKFRWTVRCDNRTLERTETVEYSCGAKEVDGEITIPHDHSEG